MTTATLPNSTLESVEPMEQHPLLLDVSHTVLHVTPDQFDQLCQDNPDLRLELTKEGELIVMAPAGGETGSKNLDLATDVNLWNRQTNRGRAFDSSTGYDFTAIGGASYLPMCPGSRNPG